MQFRGLLVAVAILAILGVGVYFSNKTKPDEEKKDETPKVLSIPEDQISEISIRKGDTTLTLKKGDKWEITAPEALRADQDAVNGIVSTIGTLNADRMVEEKAADLTPFGLKTPQIEVSIAKKDGKTTRLLIGDETATGNGFFAKLDGNPKIYTIASYNKSSFDKSVSDVRDKRLVAFDSDKVSRVELSAKSKSIEFGKNGQSEWQIVKPQPYRADNFAVEEVVRKIKDAKMDTSVSAEDAKKAASEFASGTKIATARVTDAAGTHEIEVRKKGDTYYAKGSAVAGVYKVTSELGEGLDKSLDDFRNKKLFEFGFNDPMKIEVKDQAGQTKVYQKSGDKWMLGSQQMDSVSVQSFVDKLRDLTSIAFADSGFTTPPVFDIRLTAKEGKLVDHVQISKAGDKYFAVRVNEPSVYELAPQAVTEMEQAARDVKSPATGKDEKKKK